MHASIRISYWENADHLMEASEEGQIPVRALPNWVGNLIIGLLFGGAITVALVQEARKGVETRILLLALASVVVVLCFWMVVFKKLGLGKPSRISRKTFEDLYRKQTDRDGTRIVCEFGEAGYLITGDGGFSAHNPWATVIRAVERQKGVLLFTGPQCFNWFPKRAFASESDYQSLLRLIEGKVVKFERPTSPG